MASLPGQARADCVQTGTTVTCTAPGTGGFDAGAQNGLSLAVQSGATVTIGSNFGTGIILNDGNDPVINNGTINSTKNFVVGIQLGNNNGLTTGVVNNGTMSFTGATSFAITGGNGNIVINNNSITASNSPGLISLTDNNTITNNGLLKDNASGRAINVQDGNTVVNGAAGTITIVGAGTGINAQNTAGTTAAGTITNAGTIGVGAGGTGINAFQNYTINNTGGITAGAGGDGIAITQNNRINNTGSGSITAGSSGNAIHILGGTGNVLNNSATITSSGIGILLNVNSGLTVNNTTGASILATASGGQAILVNEASTAVINNSGAITADTNAIIAVDLSTTPSTTTVTNNAGGTITSTAAGSVAISIGNGNTGTITNAGTITGVANAVFGEVNSTVNVTNSGTITGTGTSGAAIKLNGAGTVTNLSAGTITASGLSATGIIFGSGTNTLNNAGIINANNVSGTGVSIGGSGTYTNTGTINANGGTSKGIDVSNFGFGTATIVNNGNVNANDTSSTNYGVIGESGSTLILTNTGNISAAGNTGIGVQVDSNSTVNNSGKITVGDFGFAVYAQGTTSGGNTIVNSGSIQAGASGAGILTLSGTGNTVTNLGTITVGASSFGMAISNNNASLPLSSSPDVVNAGTIIGGASATGIALADLHQVLNSGNIIVGASGTGVSFTGTGSVLTNTGTIRAGAGGISINACACTTSTVNNSGTVDGQIFMDGTAAFNNSGLVTITDTGTAIGTAHFINGAFSQSSTGVLALRIDSAAAADQMQVLSVPSLAGTMRAVVQSGLYGASTTYNNVFFSATTVTNQQFGSFTSSSPFFTVTPIYDTGNAASYASVSLQLNRVGFGSVPGETPNQRAVGSALEGAYSTGLTGAAAALYGNLLAAPSANALDQLSGAGTAATQTGAFGAGETFNNTMTQQGLAWLTGSQDSGFGAPLQYAAGDKATTKAGYEAFASLRPQRAQKAPEWRAWALGFGATRTVDGNAGTAGQTINTGGGAFGVERTFGADLLLGLAAGGSASSFSVSGLSTSGHLDGGHVGGYAVSRWGTVYALAAVNYAHFENTTDRTITGIGATENAHGRFGSDQIGGRFELGWRNSIAGYAVTPFVAIEPAVLRQQAYTESSTTAAGGAGTLGLSYNARQTTSLPSFVGAQLDGQYAFGNGQILRPFLRASWVHEFMPERQIEASFVSIPSASFTVDGARPARDAARISGGTSWTIDASKSVFARLDSEFSGSGTMVAGTAGVRITW